MPEILEILSGMWFIDSTLRFAATCFKRFGPDDAPNATTVHLFLASVAIQQMALEAVS